MTYSSARRWLGLYFLIFSAIVGSYVLLFAESPILPLSNSDAKDAFQIVIPVLLGQVTIMFQWIAQIKKTNDKICPIPSWAIIAPPLLSALIVITASVAMFFGNWNQGNAGISPSAFKGALTFSISILNASTVFLVAKLFPSSRDLSHQEIPDGSNLERANYDDE